MMPVIRLSDATFEGLSTIAKWSSFRTPSEAIDSLVREKLRELGIERDAADAAWSTFKTNPQAIDDIGRKNLNDFEIKRDAVGRPEMVSNYEIMTFDRAPGLSFTRLTAAKVGGIPVRKLNWVNLLVDVIVSLKKKGLDVPKLCAELQVPTKPFEHSDTGFVYYPELGISIQGQSAQDVWKEVHRIASKWAIPVEAEFQWRQNEKAQHPGRSGVLKTGSK